jgi:hypothetical protein
MNSSNSEFMVITRSVELQIRVYFAYIVIIPGMLLITFNIFMFNRKAFARNIRFFYTCLSIIDFCNMLIYMLAFFPGPTNISRISDFTCIIFGVLIRFLSQASNWTNVMISFDRVISTLFNAKYRSILCAKYLWSSMAIVLGFTFLTSLVLIPSNLFVNTFVYKNETITQTLCTNRRGYQTLANNTGFVFRLILPISLLILSNIVLIYKLFGKKKQMNKLNRNDYKFAYTIVSLNFTFILLNLPLNAINILEYFMNPQSSIYNMYVVYFVKTSATHIYYIYLSYTFIFHLKFNTIFRKELLEMAKIFSNKLLKLMKLK